MGRKVPMMDRLGGAVLVACPRCERPFIVGLGCPGASASSRICPHYRACQVVYHYGFNSVREVCMHH